MAGQLAHPYTSLWIDVVAVLSRRPETRAAALALAERTAAMIQSDTNIRDRITAHGGWLVHLAHFARRG